MYPCYLSVIFHIPQVISPQTYPFTSLLLFFLILRLFLYKFIFVTSLLLFFIILKLFLHKLILVTSLLLFFIIPRLFLHKLILVTSLLLFFIILRWFLHKVILVTSLLFFLILRFGVHPFCHHGRPARAEQSVSEHTACWEWRGGHYPWHCWWWTKGHHCWRLITCWLVFVVPGVEVSFDTTEIVLWGKAALSDSVHLMRFIYRIQNTLFILLQEITVSNHT